jgi:hypothetical protein
VNALVALPLMGLCAVLLVAALVILEGRSEGRRECRRLAELQAKRRRLSEAPRAVRPR